MTNFEFAFSLFGVLLGLSLAEIAGGFAKALKRHGRHKLGLLTPLLAIFLAYDIATFWVTAWRARDVLPIHIAALVGGLAITGLYYFAAALVWPDDGTPDWDDLDAWMLAHKRQVMLSVVTCNVVAVGCVALLVPGSFHYDPVQAALVGTYFAAMLVVAFAPARRVVLSALSVLVALYALDLAVNVTGG
jgi:hypothetical protein